jgi:hypothetical protein
MGGDHGPHGSGAKRASTVQGKHVYTHTPIWGLILRPCAATNGHEDRDDAVAQGGIERPCFSGGRGRLRVQVLPASPAPGLAHH